MLAYFRERQPLVLAAAATVAASAWATLIAYLSPRFGAGAPVILLVASVLPLLALAIFVYPPVGPILVFATFPIASVQIGGPAWLQLPEVTVVAVATIIGLRRLAVGQLPLAWAPALVWPLALVGWALLVLPSALDGTLGIKQVAQLLFGLVFVCSVLAACRNTDDVRRVLGGLVGVATFIVILGLASGGASHLTAQYSGEQVYGRFQGSFDQPNQLGSFCALATLTAIGLALGSRGPRARLAATLAFPILVVGLALSLSRGAWIGSLLAFAYLLVSLAQARRAAAVLAVPIVVVALVIASTQSAKPEIEVVKARASVITTRSPYDSRSAIYAEAKREILEAPVTGEGPGNFPVASLRATSEASTVAALHAHDIWLTWAAECGLPAAAIIAAFCLALARAGRRAARAARDRRDRALVAGIIASLIALLGQGFVDYVFRNEVLFLALWALIAALLVADRERREAVSLDQAPAVDYESLRVKKSRTTRTSRG